MTPTDHGLEFLLAFDGRVHHLEKRYRIEFEIKRVAATAARPHGLSYSLTLHDPRGRRLVGFDNAHRPLRRGSRFGKIPAAHDHWHRTAGDRGRPHSFSDAAQLIIDFFNEVERVLAALGVETEVIAVEEKPE